MMKVVYSRQTEKNVHVGVRKVINKIFNVKVYSQT